MNIQRSGLTTVTALSELFMLFAVDTQVTKPELCVFHSGKSKLSYHILSRLVCVFFIKLATLYGEPMGLDTLHDIQACMNVLTITMLIL